MPSASVVRALQCRPPSAGACEEDRGGRGLRGLQDREAVRGDVEPAGLACLGRRGQGRPLQRLPGVGVTDRAGAAHALGHEGPAVALDGENGRRPGLTVVLGPAHQHVGLLGSPGRRPPSGWRLERRDAALEVAVRGEQRAAVRRVGERRAVGAHARPGQHGQEHRRRPRAAPVEAARHEAPRFGGGEGRGHVRGDDDARVARAGGHGRAVLRPPGVGRDRHVGVLVTGPAERPRVAARARPWCGPGETGGGSRRAIQGAPHDAENRRRVGVVLERLEEALGPHGAARRLGRSGADADRRRRRRATRPERFARAWATSGPLDVIGRTALEGG